MAGTAHFNSRGQRGQHRAASTTSGGPDSPGDAQADQQQSAEVTSEILEADTPAETPEELDMDGSDLFRAFLESNPTGEPLNPELRGERMWEPFADVDLSDLPEDYGGKIQTIDDYDDMLEQWGALMEAEDYGGVLTMLEQRLPKVEGIPPLDELIQMDSRAEQREERRRIEAALQEEYATRRVRSVDELGRAYATGRRKTSVAQVWIWPGPGSFSVNRRPLDMHFTQLERRNDVLAPFEVTGLLGGFNVMATVRGGGATGQAQALRHGIACALQKWDPDLRPPLKTAGFLTRDSRIVERKKPGRAKARKSFQWVKR